MATFNSNTVGSDVSPSYSPRLTIEQNVTTVELGDGYQQRLLKGLNTKIRKYSLPFNQRTDQAVTNILNFLSSSTGGNNGAKSFTWTPPYGLTGKWICENISVTNVAHNLNDLTLDFTEVFETE